jgi:hypothetical protein
LFECSILLEAKEETNIGKIQKKIDEIKTKLSNSKFLNVSAKSALYIAESNLKNLLMSAYIRKYNYNKRSLTITSLLEDYKIANKEILTAQLLLIKRKEQYKASIISKEAVAETQEQISNSKIKAREIFSLIRTEINRIKAMKQ